MTKLSADQLNELLSIDPSDSRNIEDIVAGKLRELLPEKAIEISIQQDADSGLVMLDISGYQFSSDGKRKSQHTIACIVLLGVLNEKTLATAYEQACMINMPGGKTSYPVAVGSDIDGVSVFILSRTAECSMQDLGFVALNLNSDFASELWPDAIGVCNAGLVNFSAFVPGRGKMGTFFVPRGGSQNGDKGAPSVTVPMILRASKDGAFPQVARLITARCGIALRDSRIPNYELISSNFPSHGLALINYQFDLSGQLRPQIFEQSLAAQLPGNQFLIESSDEKLGSIRFLPWQDGAVIKMSGKLLMELFFSFLRTVVPSLQPDQLQFFREGDLQISYVIPITNEEFIKTLNIFNQRSSNIVIRWDDEKHLVQKVSDEGLSSKFVSRLKFGVLALRDAVFFENDQQIRFDELFDDVYNGLQSVREARDGIVKAWRHHEQKFDSGEIVSRRQSSVHITENIDRAIRRETENLWISAVRVVKQSSQVFLREYGLETGFLFRKKSTFEKCVEMLRAVDAPLAEYLVQTREWTEPLILLRNDNLEHGKPIKLKIDYDIGVEPPCIRLPSVSGLPLNEYAEFILDRCCVYVEEMTAHCIKKKLPSSLTITEVPIADREETAAVRFSITVFPSGAPEWNISYESTSFENR